MTQKLILLALVLGAVGGCSSGSAPEAPMTAASSEARTETANKNIEASTMPPDQKAAAAEYMRRGAEGARQTEASVRQAQGTAGTGH